MAERIFLESVGKPYSSNAIGSAKTWEVRHLRNDPTIPPLIYVVESEVGQRFLLGREICGRPKFNMIRYIAGSFIELFLEQLRDKEVSQYLILRGAYPFDLQFAMGCASPYDRLLLPTGFIKLQRVLNQEGTDWEIHTQNLIGEYHGDTWLIPDTAIASGSTIAFFLRNGFERHLPKRVYVFSACGSLEGIQRIYRECQKKDVELIPVFSMHLRGFKDGKPPRPSPHRPLCDPQWFYYNARLLSKSIPTVPGDSDVLCRRHWRKSGRSRPVFDPYPLGDADFRHGSKKRGLGCLDSECPRGKVPEEGF